MKPVSMLALASFCILFANCKPRSPESRLLAAGTLVESSEFDFVVGFAYVNFKEDQGISDINDCFRGQAEKPLVTLNAQRCELKPFCTGSLIDDISVAGKPFILTAGHCMTAPSEDRFGIVVSLGRGWKNLIPLGKLNVMVHELFLKQSSQNLTYDISIISLPKEFSSLGKVSLKLPPEGFKLESNLSGDDFKEYEIAAKKIFSTARDQAGARSVDYKLSDSLLRKLPMVSLVGFGLVNEYVENDGKIAAEGDDGLLRSVILRAFAPYSVGKNDDLLLIPQKANEGVCSGDSGGPFFVEDKTFGRIQVGIVSFGINPCQGTSHAAINVMRFRDWIIDSAKKL